MIADPALIQVEEHLGDLAFRAGVLRGSWVVVEFEFPLLYVDVRGTGPAGETIWHRFRIQLDGFPGQAPWVRIWDKSANQSLPGELRPKGNLLVERSFQVWGDDTVYRPWERKSRDHNNFHTTFPELAWVPGRRLSFILEDLSDILTANDARIAATAEA